MVSHADGHAIDHPGYPRFGRRLARLRTLSTAVITGVLTMTGGAGPVALAAAATPTAPDFTGTRFLR